MLFDAILVESEMVVDTVNRSATKTVVRRLKWPAHVVSSWSRFNSENSTQHQVVKTG